MPRVESVLAHSPSSCSSSWLLRDCCHLATWCGTKGTQRWLSAGAVNGLFFGQETSNSAHALPLVKAPADVRILAGMSVPVAKEEPVFLPPVVAFPAKAALSMRRRGESFCRESGSGRQLAESPGERLWQLRLNILSVGILAVFLTLVLLSVLVTRYLSLSGTFFAFTACSLFLGLMFTIFTTWFIWVFNQEAREGLSRPG